MPRTRAEARAAREAEAREAAAREAAAHEAAAREAEAREAEAHEAEAREAPAAREPVVPEAPAAREPVVPEDEARAAREDSDVSAAPPARETAETPARQAPPTAPRRRFLIGLGAVLGILVLVGMGLGIVSLLQGPRLTEVQVDPARAVEASGSRVILTANQALAPIDADQVTVEPEVPFTVDSSGRGLGVRFTVPLDDDTEYTVRVADVTGAGGGPTTVFETSFTTPASEIFLLRRDASGDDTIFLTDLTGENAVPVFAHDKINDFRATSTSLVVAVEEDEGSRLIVMKRDGSDQRDLKLPGEGYVSAVQVSDRGGYVGYSYSDRELSDTEGRASVLVTQSIDGEDEPRVTEVAGAEASVFAWQFVPDTAAVLFIDFDGALSLVDRSAGDDVRSLGLAAALQGVTRGTYTAIVERLDGTVVELDLADGSEQPLAASDPDYGLATSIIPFPGGTLRHIVARDDIGMPVGQVVVRVDDDGAATPIVEVGTDSSIIQVCASPSGQYAAVVIAPDMTKNAYDRMLLPLPERMETHLLDLRTGDELVALTGFDASWCHTAPRF